MILIYQKFHRLSQGLPFCRYDSKKLIFAQVYMTGKDKTSPCLNLLALYLLDFNGFGSCCL